MTSPADTILVNGRFTTLDPATPAPEAVAIAGDRIAAVGDMRDVLPWVGRDTRMIDCGGRRVIPGLCDNHTHVIRGGLSFNLELRWDGVPSLADAMRMLRRQAEGTPPPQWVRVVGGFTEHQFAERRLPTLDEINAAAPDTPVFILHLYDRALLNRAALRAIGIDRNSADPPGGVIERDARGEPTGLLIASPNAAILYASLAKGPKLPYEYQLNSTRHFLKDLNRLGITSVLDAGGGNQHYPEDYAVIEELHREDQLTVRIGYNLFTQRPGEEREDFLRWTRDRHYKDGDLKLHLNGAGEMLVYSAADFEDFRMPRPDLPERMEGELEDVVRILAANGWPWRLHATYDESIGRALDVFERVHADIPIDRLHWFFDHAETVSARTMDRIAALGGGLAFQHRMAFQGEYFAERYGHAAAARTPPVAEAIARGLPVSAGTDATRVASYDPWVCLSWLVTGKTLGGLSLYPVRNRLSREAALRMWTTNIGWFSGQEGVKGQLKTGQLADLAVLDRDYFTVPEPEIRQICSVLTLLGGRVVHASGDFDSLAPQAIPAMPDWSPRNLQPDTLRPQASTRTQSESCACRSTCGLHGHDHARAWSSTLPVGSAASFLGLLGCLCWAV